MVLMLRRMLRRMRKLLIMSLADFCLAAPPRQECGHHQSLAGIEEEGGESRVSQFTPV